MRYNNQTSKYCLSGGADRTIRLWNPGAGKEVKVYKGHGYEVLGLDMYVSFRRPSSALG